MCLFIDVHLFKMNPCSLGRVLLWHMDSFFNTQSSERVLSCTGIALKQYWKIWQFGFQNFVVLVLDPL